METDIEVRTLSDRHHVSRRGTAWCGTHRLGHFIPKGLSYRTTVAIVDGEFNTWTICYDCEGDLHGYEMPVKHELGSYPTSP